MYVYPKQAVRAKIYVRVPSWASGQMPIAVNGMDHVMGAPGTYAVLDRNWMEGDRISFTLPIRFKISRYEGTDQVAGRERFSVEYGPILMSALGLAEERLLLPAGVEPHQIAGMLQPVAGKALQFQISTAKGIVNFIPYYQIDLEEFSSVPIIEAAPLVF